MQPSSRIQSTSPAIIDDVINEYGDKVQINLARGATFFGMSSIVREKMASLLQQDNVEVHDLSRYGDVLGTPALRKVWTNVIFKDYRDRCGTAIREIDDDSLDEAENLLRSQEFMITAGANQGFINAILATCDAGDEVLLILPYYFSHFNALLMTGVKPVCVPVSPTSFLPNINDIEKRISSRTRALVVVNPGNPSGVVIQEDLIDSIAHLCKSKGIWLIVDEAYREFIFTEESNTTYSRMDDAGIIHLYTASKAYGLAGWRIGAIRYPIMLSDAMRKAQDTIPTHPSKFSERVALEAIRYNPLFENGQTLSNIGMVRDVRKIFIDALLPVYKNSHLSHLFVVPNGAFYFFLPYADPADTFLSPAQDMKIIERLALEFAILVVPGSAFGMAGYIRVSYGCLAPADAKEAATGLARGLQAVIYPK